MSQTVDVPIQATQEQFVRMMPDIERIAGSVFKHVNPVDREEAIAETLALCWQNYVHCALVGKDVKASSMAFYAIKAVRSGRRLHGPNEPDPQPRPAQTLSEPPSGGICEWADALTAGPAWQDPLEHTRIRLDYDQFLQLPQVTQQERKVFRMLALRFRSCEMAEALSISRARVSQLKNTTGKKLVAFFGKQIWPDSGRRRADSAQC